jgi:hypothetical protein
MRFQLYRPRHGHVSLGESSCLACSVFPKNPREAQRAVQLYHDPDVEIDSFLRVLSAGRWSLTLAPRTRFPPAAGLWDSPVTSGHRFGPPGPPVPPVGLHLEEQVVDCYHE